MAERSVKHATFVIERDYAALPSTVFAAWAEPAAKKAWFAGEDEGWDDVEHAMDFRVGGQERATGRQPGGPLHICDAVYQNIVPDRRIVWTYRMSLDDKPISMSLATVEFLPSDKGTRQIYTEQVTFLDLLDDTDSREAGCAWLMDQLGEHLAAEAAAA